MSRKHALEVAFSFKKKPPLRFFPKATVTLVSL
jgi:hypothetical protein